LRRALPVAWIGAAGAAAVLLLGLVVITRGTDSPAAPPADQVASAQPTGATATSAPVPVAALADAGPASDEPASDDATDESERAPITGERAIDAAPVASPASELSGDGELAVGDDEELPGGEDSKVRDTRTPEQRRADAEAHYQDGVRDYVGGDLAAAQRAFRRAIASDSRYAPAHRGIGLVYERTRDTARALRAYRRYLRLAPTAADAASIRARIERLGG
jgi:tetratricopeptide (TPR) repeat protein